MPTTDDGLTPQLRRMQAEGWDVEAFQASVDCITAAMQAEGEARLNNLAEGFSLVIEAYPSEACPRHYIEATYGQAFTMEEIDNALNRLVARSVVEAEIVERFSARV